MGVARVERSPGWCKQLSSLRCSARAIEMMTDDDADRLYAYLQVRLRSDVASGVFRGLWLFVLSVCAAAALVGLGIVLALR